MGIIGTVLLVVFVIICVLIVALVLIQNEEGDSLGGLFSGGSNSAFGSRSANVLTKTTYVVVALFFVSAFLLAFVNKRPDQSGVEKAARVEQGATATEWWNSTPAPAEAPATAPTDSSAADAPVVTTPATTPARPLSNGLLP